LRLIKPFSDPDRSTPMEGWNGVSVQDVRAASSISLWVKSSISLWVKSLTSLWAKSSKSLWAKSSIRLCHARAVTVNQHGGSHDPRFGVLHPPNGKFDLPSLFTFDFVEPTAHFSRIAIPPTPRGGSDDGHPPSPPDLHLIYT
jgi:hypothetical protein